MKDKVDHPVIRETCHAAGLDNCTHGLLVHIGGCGQCMVHCPQTIKIPDELHRIDQYIEKLKQETL